MWKVTLGLITHRIFLIFIAFCAINTRIAPQEQSSPTRSIQPAAILWSTFIEKVNTSKEATQIKELLQEPFGKMFSLTKDPFIWLNRFFTGPIGLPISLSLLFFSNLFLFLFLWELYTLVSHMALPEVAISTCLLCVLWLTSYELSLGSTLSLSCLLATVAVRHGMDNNWIFSGIALGLLALTKPFAVLLLPLLIILFWQHQRHFEISEVARRALYLLVPIGLAIYFNLPQFQAWRSILNDSALLNIVSASKQGQGFSWTVSQSYLGQSIAILILLVGTIASFLVYSDFLHRVLPLYLLLALLLSTPYREVATGALLAAPAFSGIAGASAPALLESIQALFLCFGSAEVFKLF